MFCYNCGTKVEDDLIFCTNCGVKLVEEATAQVLADEGTQVLADEGTQVLVDEGTQVLTAVETAQVLADEGTQVLVDEGTQVLTEEQPQPVAPQPTYTQPVAPQPTYTQPVYTQPVASQPTYTQPQQTYTYETKQRTGSPQKTSFGGAIKLFFTNYVNFSGRSTRSEFWWAYLFNGLVSLVTLLIPALGVLAGLGMMLPGLALSVRRLHDAGKSWTYLFMGLIPFAGVVLLIIQFCKESDADNQWGPAA